MSSSGDKLISDIAEAPRLASAYIALGYHPVPCGTRDNPRAWIDRNPKGVALNRGSPPESVVLEVFHDNPGCGIGIAAPALRGSDLGLMIADIDIDDPVLIRRACLALGSPTPLRFGSKGAAVFATFSGDVSPATIAEARGIENFSWKSAAESSKEQDRSWFNKSDIRSRDHDGNRIELIGIKDLYAIVPPTLSMKSGRPYKWIPHPITGETYDLLDFRPDDLPRFTQGRMLLLMLACKPGTRAIWEFLGQTDDGDWHDRCVRGTLQMAHEGLTDDEILLFCQEEIDRIGGSASKKEERLKDAKKAIKGAFSNVEKKGGRNPSKPSSGGRGKGGPKIPPDRLQAEWLLSKFDPEDVGTFNGVPHRWSEKSRLWKQITDEEHPQPWHAVYKWVFTEFPEANHNSVKQALLTFAAHLPVRHACEDMNLIPFANGVLDVRDMTLRPEEREDYILGRIPHDYDPSVQCPRWEVFINALLRPGAAYTEELTEEQINEDHRLAVDLVEEYLGYCLVRSYRYRHFLLLIGRTSTGKSVLTKVLHGLLPKGWLTEVALEKFSEPNSIRRMSNAHVNISSETGRQRHVKAVDDQVLRITSKEPVEAKTLYQDTIDVKLPARLIVNGNMSPEFNDSTGAIERRMLFISTTDIQPDPIPEFEAQLLEEAPGILQRLVRAYGRLLARGSKGFIKPSYSSVAARMQTEESNSVAAWVSRACERTEQHKDGTDTNVLYADYSEWAQQNGMKPFSSVQWGKILGSMGLEARTTRTPGGTSRFRALRVKHIAGVKY